MSSDVPFEFTVLIMLVLANLTLCRIETLLRNKSEKPKQGEDEQERAA